MATAPSSSKSGEPGSQAYLPDFCAATTVFVVVVVAALVAIVLTLAGTSGSGRFLFELSKTALSWSAISPLVTDSTISETFVSTLPSDLSAFGRSFAKLSSVTRAIK